MTHYAFYPTTGGVESHLLDLCSELVKQGHDVFALVQEREGRPKQEEIRGIQVHRNHLMDPEWIRNEKKKKQLEADVLDPEILDQVRTMYSEFVDDHDLDVVHGHNFHHFVPEHALALTDLWKKGLPNILTVHEVWSECLCEDLLEKAKWDFIISFCNHVADGILEQAPHLENMKIVPPGIDVKELFTPENRNTKWADKLGLEGRRVIMHPARMLPWKGVIYSVRAMKKIVERFPDALLIITDTDDIVDWIRELKGYKEEVLRMIEDLDLTDNIVTQPFPYPELPWVYNYADIVIYPTIGEEPFGLVPVEGMACAKPVVVTPSGGMVESVIDGETGFFIPKKDSSALADCLIQLLSDDDLARRIGENGRKRAVEVFSRERMARDTAGLYEKAVEIHQPELVGT
jgi:glycosyltransferase involved in cell wall biosynthesis